MQFATSSLRRLVAQKGLLIGPIHEKGSPVRPQPKGTFENLCDTDRLSHVHVFARTQNIYIRTRKHSESERILQTATYITGSHGGDTAIIKIKQIPIVF